MTRRWCYVDVVHSGEVSSVVGDFCAEKLKTLARGHTGCSRDDTLNKTVFGTLLIFRSLSGSRYDSSEEEQWLVINSSKWHISISAHFHDRCPEQSTAVSGSVSTRGGSLAWEPPGLPQI